MRRLILVPVVAALVCCRDLGTGSGVVTRPQPQDAHSDLGASSDQWNRMPPEERNAGLRTIQQVSAENGISQIRAQIALADAELPGGVATLIVRNPDAPDQYLLVLSPTRPVDEALAEGLTTFAQTRSTHASTASGASQGLASRPREVAGVAAPELVRRLAAARELSARGTFRQVLASATSVTVIDIPGVGRATLFHFD
ncbi:MAG TPA: hypothetical protein VFY65_06300 [Longimicrobium sp.]|nr:hypothetical protein [Longimicrobium sp.]